MPGYRLGKVTKNLLMALLGGGLAFLCSSCANLVCTAEKEASLKEAGSDLAEKLDISATPEYVDYSCDSGDEPMVYLETNFSLTQYVDRLNAIEDCFPRESEESEQSAVFACSNGNGEYYVSIASMDQGVVLLVTLPI